MEALAGRSRVGGIEIVGSRVRCFIVKKGKGRNRRKDGNGCKEIDFWGFLDWYWDGIGFGL